MATQSGGHHRQIALERVSDIPDAPDDRVSNLAVLRYGSGVAGHFLVVQVGFGGGTAEHEFRAYWDGSWMKSDPPGIWIHLRHDANGDTGKARFEEQLQIKIDEPASLNREFFVLVAGGGSQSEPFNVTVDR